MWEEWDQKIPGGGRYYGITWITWITIKPDPSNNEFSLTFFSEKCGGGNCRFTVSERKYYFSKVLLLLNLIGFFFIYIRKISKGDNSVCKLEFKWQEMKNQRRYENFWWTIISSSIYLPTFSVISVLFKLSRQKCKRNPFLSIQGELFNSAVGKRDIMHRRTIKKFLYTVVISNEIVFH